MKILTTGGAGYIGSHTCLELLKAGHEVIVVDNLANSSVESLKRVQKLAGKPLHFYHVDLLDKQQLASVFSSYRFDAVIHFAGFKAVGESTLEPLRYFHNNVAGTLTLFEVMAAFKVNRLVFSSSATVYGEPKKLPIAEDAPLSATNPYGRTKLMIEEIMRDLCVADESCRFVILRYFNPVGAHESGMIGEAPRGTPNNLFPYVSQVAVGKLKELLVYGNDYPTPDGTGVRDYIHVCDLAAGHVKALARIAGQPGLFTYNLGTGRGYSVFEVINAYSKACGRPIPYRVVARRPGDVAACYADPSLANRELGWRAELGLDRMCADAWRWQSKNPNGYEKE